MKWLGYVSPSAEPVAWGTLFTAIFYAALVFAPRFGIMLTQPESIALGGIDLAVVAIIVRGQVSPSSPNVSATGTGAKPGA